MKDLAPLLYALLVAAIIIAAIVATRYLFRRRGNQVAKEAARLRCHYLPDGRRLPVEELKALPWFATIEPIKLTDLLHRRDIDVATYICDWHTRGKQTIALMRFDEVIFQDFSLCPEKQTGDEAFTEAANVPDLDSRYRLRFRDPVCVTLSIFSTEFLRFLRRQEPPLSLGASGPWMLIYRENRTVGPREFSTFLGEIHSIAGMIKRSSGKASLQSHLPQ